MDRPWEATHAVSAEQARGLIAAQFPSLANAEVELLGVGWDNSVFAVGGEWVFRFPRREIALQLLDAECSLLPVYGSDVGDEALVREGLAALRFLAE